MKHSIRAIFPHHHFCIQYESIQSQFMSEIYQNFRDKTYLQISFEEPPER
jgi:hypothetical protein